MKRTFTIITVVILASAALFAQNRPFRRFQIELFGGFANINPADLNMALETEEDVISYEFNERYYYLRNINYIRSFTYNRNGSYKKINRILPFGLRVKANILPSFSVSLGCRYFNQTQSFSVAEEFTIIENSGTTSMEISDYSPMELRVKGVSVQAGIHLGQDIGKFFRIEGFAAFGPVWAECGFSYDNTNIQRYGDSGLEFIYEYSQQIEGKDSGLAMDLGIQLILKLKKRIQFFAEGSHSFTRLNNLYGPGSQTVYDTTESWEGKIRMQEVTYWNPWRAKEFTFLNNNWQGQEDPQSRNMILDLSGFSLTFGFIIKL